MYEFTCEGANGINKLTLTTDDFEKFSKVMYLLEELQEYEEEKPKFDIKKYKDGNYAMHLESQNMSDIFSKYLDSIGKTWCNGNKYTAENHWETHRENSGYNFNTGRCDYISNYKKAGYTILEFTDFDWN